MVTEMSRKARIMSIPRPRQVECQQPHQDFIVEPGRPLLLMAGTSDRGQPSLDIQSGLVYDDGRR